ncbi:MAG: toxin glutamine deamidase domain-containing protein [Lachnospiraceae bacterium]|nr:toxin glutamine deamidase domain-containing protein [Lachnospiraceae bacterium]
MGAVNVNVEVLVSTVQNMKSAIQSIENTKQSISRKYQQLGQDWNDKKYKELGDTIQACNSAFASVLKILLQGEKYVIQLYDALQKYEETNFSGSLSGTPRHFTANEESARWQSIVDSINVEIENYKTELMNRNVPECKWLNDTLARHRAAMLEQEGYNLNVASGNGSISTNSSNAYTYPTDYSNFYDDLANQFRQYSLQATNPNYNVSPQWRDNCQRCVPTHEMRRRGSEVSARPSTYGAEYLSYHPFDVWQNANVLHCQGNGMEDIQNAMHSWGDGARAQIVVYWDSPHGGGHTFIAEQRNGETIFSDPQTGNVNVINYFNRVVRNQTQFCRIDNLEFSDYIDECYQEV